MSPQSKPQLTLVEPSENPNANVLLYGAPKTGKTIGAASAPKPLLFLNADRPNATRMAHSLYEFDEAQVEGLETLIAALHAIDSGDYASVVLDPLADVYRVILEELSGRSLHPKIQMYGDTGTHLERFCRALCEKPVNAIFVAHETAQRDEESGGFERLPYTGTNNPAIGAKLGAVVDVIGYTGVVVDEKDNATYMAQLVNARGRRGGDRFGVLGPSREMNLSEWVDLARSVKPNNKRKPKEGAAAA